MSYRSDAVKLIDLIGQWLQHASLTKWLMILAFAVLGALMQRDLTIWGRLLAVAAGLGAAVIFAEPIRQFLSLDPSWSDAVAAGLALTGRNWAAFALRASRDPLATVGEFLRVWRGRS
ncbi:hypothetical protein GWI72_10345 [Microvirga tunisiensis]|uniref:Uncharacterized protein n=1 Tax=Pannonibacter tanglangensis TaxID=2750084 RepID=A0A7X5F2P9_9HYPH|nr:hypothetical protein [Pannonibacter sp. XCT-53]